MEAAQKGKTLWEMLLERLHGGGNSAGIAFHNPLDLRIGSLVIVPAVNGPELSLLKSAMLVSSALRKIVPRTTSANITPSE